MKIIYMSGYTEGSFGSDTEEELVKSAPLLQKPFKLDDLALKIREALIAARHH